MTAIETLKAQLKKEAVQKNQAFILSLSSEVLREMRTELKVICKEYLEYREVKKKKHSSWEMKASQAQIDILNFTGLFAFTKNDFLRICNPWRLRQEVELTKIILDTGRITWFPKYLAENNFFGYLDQMMFAKAGYFDTPQETLVSNLVYTISDYHYKRKPKFIYKPEVLYIYPETLSEHIWKFFEYDTNINHNDDSRYQERDFEHPVWKYTFKNLITEGKIERLRVLREALLTSNRNFNKVLSGWFYDLFLYLEPSTEELLVLQTELFIALSCPHSKIVNGILKIFKKLALEEGFLSEDFLDTVPLLLSAETKSVANSTLMIMDKMAKKYPRHRSILVEEATNAFNSSFKDVQLRAAKLISKYGDSSDEELKYDITAYAENLFSDSRILLMDYIIVSEIEEEEEDYLEEPAFEFITPDNEIHKAISFEDFIYIASQAFDNNEAYHFDLFLQGLIDFQEEMLLNENLVALEPAFQRAFKALFNDLRGNAGHIDEVSATLFIDYGNSILLKNRDVPQGIKKLFEKYTAQDKADNKAYSWYSKKIVALNKFKLIYHDDSNYFTPFLNKALLVLDCLKNKKKLQLLSNPSHEPYWIAPSILVDRVEAQIQAGHIIDEADLCLAIARCSMQEQDLEVALAKAKTIGHSDIEMVLSYAFDSNAKVGTPEQYKEAMLQAYFNKKQTIPRTEWPLLESLKELKIYEGASHISPKVEDYKTTEWDYKKSKNVPVIRQRKRLNLEYSTEGFKEKLLDLFKYKQPKYLTLLYSKLNKYYSLEYRDMSRIISLYPNNSEVLFHEVFQSTFDNEDWWESTAERATIALLSEMLELPQQMAQTGTLMIAASLLAKPKTVRSLAAEYWLQQVGRGTIDSKAIGVQIGKMQSIEYTPLKRLTDLMVEQMINISKIHNQALANMIEASILEMGDKPIKNIKKYLEILGELRSKTNPTPISMSIQQKLKIWSSSASVAKVVKGLV